MSDPQWMNARQIAAQFGSTLGYFTKWRLKEGFPPPSSEFKGEGEGWLTSTVESFFALKAQEREVDFNTKPSNTHNPGRPL